MSLFTSLCFFSAVLALVGPCGTTADIPITAFFTNLIYGPVQKADVEALPKDTKEVTATPVTAMKEMEPEVNKEVAVPGEMPEQNNEQEPAV
mmetsp:Transcript_44793/g.110200  ORF Transcript_44793/g.110200 Transcript_44793/m.110200 type:complete len:92 (+) Transcript_44793:299-574(+)